MSEVFRQPEILARIFCVGRANAMGYMFVPDPELAADQLLPT